ncbi:MAG: peptidylprolyl isomerase [Lachnotalea sp.]
MNPIATLLMENGKQIVIELLPKFAPNTVNSFIYAAKQGFFDNHTIERIVPGAWIDMSYKAFGHDEAKYLIPLEFTLNTEVEPLDVKPGYVAMGGYENGIAGCEFFFPVRECPELKGKYPVFGIVTEGMDEIYRLEKVDIIPVTNYPTPGVIVNEAVEPQIIKKVELQLFGQEYANPIKVKNIELPQCWKM